MILTRQAIITAVERGEIVIEPYQDQRVSTNAYDWRLGEDLWVCEADLDSRTVRPVRIYPLMTFGKIVFVVGHGATVSYQQMGLKYTRTVGIDRSRLHEELS